VLIFQGAADTNVPPAQSWSFFRALQYYDKVPVKFVVFPGEPHGPRKLTHQMRKVEEEVAWFDKYFFKTEKPGDEALKENSLLEALFKRNRAKKDELGAYGETLPFKLGTARGATVGVALPEVVRRGEIEIARFETTRAQFSGYQLMSCIASRKKTCVQFELNLKRSSNLPEAGTALEDAKAYAAWLSTTTHQIWRLPYEDEVKALYEKRDGENTLDYWAGYAPNPGDAARLREKAKELGKTAPLLKEVGSFHGQGKDEEEPIYDLGGNVAEWVLTRDGKGKVIGGSADCPADAKSTCTPAPEYVGFRVVRGEAKPVAALEKH
jgi:hypothetical protein